MEVSVTPGEPSYLLHCPLGLKLHSAQPRQTGCSGPCRTGVHPCRGAMTDRSVSPSSLPSFLSPASFRLPQTRKQCLSAEQPAVFMLSQTSGSLAF